jgi:hypothetical protein
LGSGAIIKGSIVISDSVPASFEKISVTSWIEFSALIETRFLDWPEYIFRGQRDAQWPLRSRFDREYSRTLKQIKETRCPKGLDSQDRAVWKERKARYLKRLGSREWLLESQLERFKRASLGRRGLAPRELSVDEWWSLGRHFGLATPLLDWTRSAYLACFFAMQEAQASESGWRGVWAFSHSALREIQENPNRIVDSKGRTLSFLEGVALDSKSAETPLPSLQVLEPLIDENSRMLSQSGIFTRTPNGEDIEEFIKQNLDLMGANPVLCRIDIPEDQREAFLRQLEAMNIHSGSLFPDLSGAADYCNRAFEKEFTEILWRADPSFSDRMMSNRSSHK